MEYRFLGSFEVRRDGDVLPLGGHRQRVVLAILGLAANQTVSTDALIEQVWGGRPPKSATATIQAYVSYLRRLLEPERAPRTPAQVLVSKPNGYLLAVPDGAVDIDRFSAGTAEARDTLCGGDPVAAGRAARRALAEWRGPALADFVDEPFAIADIQRLEEARLQTLELRIDADLAAGRHVDVIAELGALVTEHPLRERLRGQLMLALYRAGRQADALEVARIGRRQLAEELGLDPDPALQDLEGKILRQDRALTPVPPTPPSVGANPPAPTAPAPVGDLEPAASDDSLVGRAEERAVLGRALAAATRGTGRVVLIGGEPGIGKTRLAETFAGDVAGARVLWGHCPETDGAPPFWPWRQVLRTLAAELDDTTLRTSLGADAAVVLDVAPELADRVGTVAPVRLPDAETARFHFFDAVTRLLTTTARSRPLVVVLEDLHWADEATMALLRFAVGAVRGSGLLIVATYRSVAVADRALLASTLGALAREPVVERLLLPGLRAEEARSLVTRLLGDAPGDELVADIIERTGGNPLFIIHLVRMVEQTLDVGEDPRSVIRDQVPPAVIDLIGLRVAEQPEATRRLLEVAAVVGRRFELGLLVQVETRSFDDAVAAVEPAIRAGLVVEDETPGAYRFTHALMREAIVAGLGRSRAGRLHGLVGDALAAGGVDARSLPALAHHYWEAARVGWADAALEAATSAAAAAVAGLAYDDAQEHLDRALALLADRSPGVGRDQAELAVRMQLATHLMRTRGYAVDEVGEACGRARELAAGIPAPAELLVASWGLAAHHLVRSEHRAAMAIGAELLAAAGRGGNPVAKLAGHQTSGVPSIYVGRPADAVHHLEGALAAARALPAEVLARFPQNVEVGAMIFLGLARWLVGEEAASEELRLGALREAGRLGGYDEVFTLMVSAQLGVLRRAPGQVLPDTARMLERCGEAGFRHLAAHARIMRGWALAVTDDPVAGVSAIEEGMAYFASNEASTRRVHNLTLLAEALGLAGRAGEARAAITEALAELETAEERFFEPETWLVHGRLLDDPAAARRSFERAVAAAEAAGAAPLRDRALGALAGEVVGAE
jgi:DNA-binding SARP family transcriptional activator